LIEFEDSNFISWLLHNQCSGEHTTCETVNKSSDGILAKQHSDETVKTIILIYRARTLCESMQNECETNKWYRVYRLFFCFAAG